MRGKERKGKKRRKEGGTGGKRRKIERTARKEGGGRGKYTNKERFYFGRYVQKEDNQVFTVTSSFTFSLTGTSGEDTNVGPSVTDHRHRYTS